GLDADRRYECPAAETEPSAQPDRSCTHVDLVRSRVDEQEGRRRAESNSLPVDGEQHAHGPIGGNAQRRVRVVVSEDPLVVPPVQRKTLCAPLAHTEAVAPARARDQEQVTGKRLPGSPETGDDDRCHSEPTHVRGGSLPERN